MARARLPCGKLSLAFTGEIPPPFMVLIYSTICNRAQAYKICLFTGHSTGTGPCLIFIWYLSYIYLFIPTSTVQYNYSYYYNVRDNKLGQSLALGGGEGGCVFVFALLVRRNILVDAGVSDSV